MYADEHQRDAVFREVEMVVTPIKFHNEVALASDIINIILIVSYYLSM